MRWQRQAACLGTEWTRWFADTWNEQVAAELTVLAEMHCRRCPSLLPCAVWADEAREQGLWAGAFRRVTQSTYKREPLLDVAPMGDLPVRPVGVHRERVA